MVRKALDCRQMPSISKCSVKISADNDEELLETGVQHAMSVHRREDTPELRDELRGMMTEES
jgi:predicted small metal-binding protein